PDGHWLIALVWPPEQPASQTHGGVNLVRFPLAGGAAETLLQLPTTALVSCPNVLSSTCILAEESDDKKGMVISTLDALGGRGQELARFPFDPAVEKLVCVLSPDGTRVAFARGSLAVIEIHSLRGELIRKIPFEGSGKLI